MTAAVAGTQHTEDKITYKELPLGFTAVAWKGATAMGRPSTGTVFPAITGAGNAGENDIFLGIFAESIDNSAGTATTKLVTINFLKEITLLFRANDGSIDASKLFNPAYALDDSTWSATSTNRAKGGTILVVDSVLGVGVAVNPSLGV